MKNPILSAIIAALWFWAPTVSAIPLHIFLGTVPPEPVVPASFLIEQTFEGTGFDNGETWATSGTHNEDSNAVSMEGSQVLELSGNSSYAQTDYTGQTTVYAFCYIRYSSDPASTQTAFNIADSSGTSLASLRIGVGGIVRIAAAGSDSSNSATTLTFGATYYVWLKFVSGGTCELAVSPTTTKPSTDGSGLVFLTKTGASATAARVRCIRGNTGGNWYFDRVLVSTTAIGDNP